MKADVVIVHWNAPLHLARTLLAFKERLESSVTFFLIDQSSNAYNLLLARFVLKRLTVNSLIIQRKNTNREAGGYWHYIEQFGAQSDIVVFTQEEIHQRGMRPKNVPRHNYTAGQPYYTEYYGINGISLRECYQWIRNNPYDQIGFGGRRYRAGIDYDKRFTTPYWIQRWEPLKLDWYDFFSGACFCVGPRIISSYLTLGRPTEADLTQRHFAWMWERMWGTIPLAVGGRLIHYKSKESNRIEEYSPDTIKNPSLANRSVTRYLAPPISVTTRQHLPDGTKVCVGNCDSDQI